MILRIASAIISFRCTFGCCSLAPHALHAPRLLLLPLPLPMLPLRLLLPLLLLLLLLPLLPLLPLLSTPICPFSGR